MTPAAVRILKDMIEDENCDLVQEGRRAFCGNRQTMVAVINELLRGMAISLEYESDGYRVFSLNETGRAIYRRPELADEIFDHVMNHKGPFQIVGGKIVLLDGGHS